MPQDLKEEGMVGTEATMTIGKFVYTVASFQKQKFVACPPHRCYAGGHSQMFWFRPGGSVVHHGANKNIKKNYKFDLTKHDVLHVYEWVWMRMIYQYVFEKIAA